MSRDTNKIELKPNEKDLKKPQIMREGYFHVKVAYLCSTRFFIL